MHKLIIKDVNWTLPESNFLWLPQVKESLIRILFIFSIRNSIASYS